MCVYQYVCSVSWWNFGCDEMADFFGVWIKWICIFTLGRVFSCGLIRLCVITDGIWSRMKYKMYLTFHFEWTFSMGHCYLNLFCTRIMAAGNVIWFIFNWNILMPDIFNRKLLIDNGFVLIAHDWTCANTYVNGVAEGMEGGSVVGRANGRHVKEMIRCAFSYQSKLQNDISSCRLKWPIWMWTLCWVLRSTVCFAEAK